MKKFFTFIFVSVLFVFAKSQNPPSACFGPIKNFIVGNYYPNGVIATDFNGDGKLDLAIGVGLGSNVWVLLGNGTGSFVSSMNYIAGNLPQSLVSDDFNGDGKPDIAAVNGNSNNVSIFLGIGTGSFLAATNFSVGQAPQDITTADFNGDGKADIATTNFSQNNVSILFGTGTGSFATAVNYGVGGNPLNIFSADFNGDGKADLAVSNYTTNNVSILLNNGLGNFSSPSNYAVGNKPAGITSKDFNGDGKLDLAVANYSSNSISVLLGTGLGSFGTPVNYGVGSQPFRILSGDLNNDGQLDIVCVNYGSNNLSILRGTGTGGFMSAVHYSVGINPIGIAAGDFNGDSKLDLASTIYYSNVVAVMLNTSFSLNVSVSNNNFCAGNSSTLIASGANAYSWIGGTGANASSYVVSPTVSTVYSVNGTNTNGCLRQATVSVTVKPSPIITFLNNNSLICSGDSVNIMANGADSYTWNSGAQTPSISFIANSTSTYSIIGTSTLTGCSAIAALQLSVSECTGILENPNKYLDIYFYPNPVKDDLILKCQFYDAKNLDLEIVNLFGEIVLQKSNVGQDEILNLSTFPKGVYFLKINSVVKKIIKD